MNHLKKHFKQSSYYFVSNLLVMLMGFVSFPVWTRVLSQEEYGIVSLINVTVFFLVAFSKFGLQRAAIRFFSDFEGGKNSLDISTYYSTLSISSCFLSGFTTIAFIITIGFLPEGLFDNTLRNLFRFTAILIFLMSASSVLEMFFVAEQKAGIYSILKVAKRYGGFAIQAILVIVFLKGLYGFFLGGILVQALILFILLGTLIHKKKIKLKTFSLRFLKESIVFGFPLIGLELSKIILSSGDRYLIHYYLGSAAVGIYSVGYNLTNYIVEALSNSFFNSAEPITLSICAKESREKAAQFVSSLLNYYLMIGIPVIFGFGLLGKEIITIAASAKFQEASVVIPWLIVPLILYGAYPIFGIGLIIEKKTSLMLGITLLSGVFNLLNNIILIPPFGLVGAAMATLISYFVYIIATALASNRYLKIKINLKLIGKFLVASTIMSLVLINVSGTNTYHLLIKVILGVIVYFASIITLDRSVRMKALTMIGYSGCGYIV